MSTVEKQHDASRRWILKRLEQVANASGVKIDAEQVALFTNPKGGEIFAFSIGGERRTLDVSYETLDDLANDAGEQAEMDARIRALLAAPK